MNRFLIQARLLMISRNLPPVMNEVFMLLDQHDYKLKSIIENECFWILRHWAQEVADAQAEGLSYADFALFLVFDAIKVELSSGDHHVYRGLLGARGPLLQEAISKTIKLMLDRGLCDKSRALELTAEIRAVTASAG